MRGNWVKILLVLVTLWVSAYFSFPWESIGLNAPWASKGYKLWLDLHGWVELDYKVDLEEAQKKAWYNESNVVEWLKSIVEKRVNSLWTAEPTIVSAKYGQESHIIVQIPTSNFDGEKLSESDIKKKNDEYIQKAKDTIWKVVRLEFKEKKTTITEADKAERKKIVEDIKKDLDSGSFTFDTVSTKYKDQFENVEYAAWTWTKDTMPQEATFSGMENVQIPYVTWIIESQKRPWYTLTQDWKLESLPSEKWYSIVKINSVKTEQKEKEVIEGTGATEKKKMEKYTETTYDYQVIFVNEKPSDWTSAKTEKWEILDERYLIRASVSISQNTFQPQVDLTFNTEWAKIFAELTKRLIGQPLAIYVWWEMLTAPTVQSVIPDWKAVITWNYTTDSANKLANDINTWIVPAPIYLTSERTIDAKIWWDSLNVIRNAWIIAFVLIIVFLVAAYGISGFLAWIALFAYITITLAIVKLSWVVLTLASIAGLILSVWLAIDANILIFERTKEELKQKNEITKSLAIWFDRSWSAIWDSHITTFISALILFKFWVNMISWFWVMLWIWVVVSLFTAMWVSRVLIMVIAPKFKDNLNLFIRLKK